MTRSLLVLILSVGALWGDGQRPVQAASDAGDRPPFVSRAMVRSDAATFVTGTPAPPVPVITATAAPVVSVTPSGTTSSTPIPIEAPAVTVIPSVKPGKVQRVVVHTRPNIGVQTKISYPNGDVQSAAMLADNSGVATYVYTQRSSRISRRGRVASVLVTAGAGPAVRSTSTSYRIFFGPVDLVLLPRIQSLGRNVNMWVHSRARAVIVVRVYEGADELDSVKVRTGSNGWVHKLYRVGAGGRLPRGQQVRVVASVTHGSRTWTTYTSLVVH